MVDGRLKMIKQRRNQQYHLIEFVLQVRMKGKIQRRQRMWRPLRFQSPEGGAKEVETRHYRISLFHDKKPQRSEGSHAFRCWIDNINLTSTKQTGN